jgi:hypothetical protein
MIDLFFIFIFAFAADHPDEIVWVGGDKGLRQVPIYYVEELDGDIKGVYRASEDSIYIMQGWGDKWALPACTIRQHEILHAWGYDHVSMSQFNCPNPNSDDPMWGTYQEGLTKHWNPHYEWTGYGVEHRVIWK